MGLGLKGLNALVTGGSKGIGRRAADILAGEGANVSICARNKEEVDEAVTTVSPGNTYFAGGVWEHIEKNIPDLFSKALALNPTGRMATPEEIGRGIAFLASPASSFTTGTNLVIDGALMRGVQF